MDLAFYLVPKNVAVRSGQIQNRYRTADGRFVLYNKDLAGIRLTTEEYVTGINGIEKVTEEEAKRQIALGGFKMGDAPAQRQFSQQQEEAVSEEAEQAAAEETEETEQESNEQHNEEGE